MRKAAFLDRDGVINQKLLEGQYVTCWEEMKFLPGVIEAIASLNEAGFHVVVISNQRCIAKGLVTTEDLDLIHERMRRRFASDGALINGIYYCPHDEHPPCGCRKPAPGLLLKAAIEHEIDLTSSWMIGDSDVDMGAGKSAGCKTVRILKCDEVPNGSADLFARSLLDAVCQIVDPGSKPVLGTAETTELSGS
jgi:D-glycero-D-manno-heptose 1,7-bisphosphate phosphatase